MQQGYGPCINSNSDPATVTLGKRMGACYGCMVAWERMVVQWYMNGQKVRLSTAVVSMSEVDPTMIVNFGFEVVQRRCW